MGEELTPEFLEAADIEAETPFAVMTRVSPEWLLRMADAEAECGGCISVGGLAVELGLYKSPRDEEKSNG
jgi:hypothetical protein